MIWVVYCPAQDPFVVIDGMAETEVLLVRQEVSLRHCLEEKHLFAVNTQIQ